MKLLQYWIVSQISLSDISLQSISRFWRHYWDPLNIFDCFSNTTQCHLNSMILNDIQCFFQDTHAQHIVCETKCWNLTLSLQWISGNFKTPSVLFTCSIPPLSDVSILWAQLEYMLVVTSQIPLSDTSITVHELKKTETMKAIWFAFAAKERTWQSALSSVLGKDKQHRTVTHCSVRHCVPRC